MTSPFAFLIEPPNPPEWQGQRRYHLTQDDGMEPKPEMELRRRAEHQEQAREATKKRMATNARNKAAQGSGGGRCK